MRVNDMFKNMTRRALNQWFLLYLAITLAILLAFAPRIADKGTECKKAGGTFFTSEQVCVSNSAIIPLK